MSRSLALFIAGLVAVSASALAAASFLYGFDSRIAITIGPVTSQVVGIGLGLAFWIGVTLVASALPVKFSGGAIVAVSTAPILAAMVLGGPAAAGWVALLGSTELRELRGEIPWFGSLSNHAGIVLPAVVAGVVQRALVSDSGDPVADLFGTAVAASIFFASNLLFASVILALRTQVSLSTVVRSSAREVASSFVALAPLAWLMTQTYERVGWWTTALYALPLVHDPTGQRAPHRDARDVHPDDRGPRRGRGQARSLHRQAQPPGQGDRLRHRPGDAPELGRDGGPRVGRAAPRRGQDRRARPRPAQAGPADPRGAPADELPSGPGRADHRAGHEARPGAADHSPPPRVVQRLGLPGSAPG